MKATELRIGNWFNCQDRQVTIEGIEPTWESVWVNYLNGHGQYVVARELVKPIPLTEQWLERFGFDASGSIWIGLNTSAQSIQIIYDGSVLVYDDEENFISLGEVEYVHQLQNLYFSLTGEELQAK